MYPRQCGSGKLKFLPNHFWGKMEPFVYATAQLDGIGGVIKSTPADFQVDEIPYCALEHEPPSASGQHMLVSIRRELWNTQDIVTALAAAFGVQEREIGYRGLKDKHALVTQTFSLPIRPVLLLVGAAKPKKSSEDPSPPATDSPEDWAHATRRIVETIAAAPDQPDGAADPHPSSTDGPSATTGSPPPRRGAFTVVGVTRSDKKIRRGQLAGNTFTIVARGVRLEASEAGRRIAAIAAALKDCGVPNYYGPQRFGKGGKTAAQGRKVVAAQLLLGADGRDQGGKRCARARSKHSRWLRELQLNALQVRETRESHCTPPPCAVQSTLTAERAAGENPLESVTALYLIHSRTHPPTPLTAECAAVPALQPLAERARARRRAGQTGGG
jgi:hypothetical protein